MIICMNQRMQIHNIPSGYFLKPHIIIIFLRHFTFKIVVMILNPHIILAVMLVQNTHLIIPANTSTKSETVELQINSYVMVTQ